MAECFVLPLSPLFLLFLFSFSCAKSEVHSLEQFFSVLVWRFSFYIFLASHFFVFFRHSLPCFLGREEMGDGGNVVA